MTCTQNHPADSGKPISAEEFYWMTQDKWTPQESIAQISQLLSRQVPPEIIAQLLEAGEIILSRAIQKARTAIAKARNTTTGENQ